MYEYRTPLRDIEFTYFDLLGHEQHLKRMPTHASLGREDVMAVVREFGRFCEKAVVPLNQTGDAAGCTLRDGEVRTPPGFKEAFDEYVQGGWPGLAFDERLGGQGLPESMSLILHEIAGGSSWAWYTYPGLAHGAKYTLAAHGTPWQQETFLRPLVAGHWCATMCLTEAHCGSDLGLLRTRAEPRPDGTYAITGTKIFITVGEHDLAPNIVHIVLARLPGAPAGSKGISLFIVPKWKVDARGRIADRNAVHCSALEHKMGLRASATCVMNFDGATGYLLGEPHQGLNAMFVFMNTARLGTATQGLAHAELGLQKSAGYARDRLQMRSLSGIKNPDGPADPIIVHPDVRRMLLTQKAIAEGARMLVAYCAQKVDLAEHSPDPELARQAGEQLSFLTPIAKAFVTELAVESANLAVQCFGGHGYIREWGVEQNLRDSRIATIYEGTTGIQALDLLARKMLASKGRLAPPVIVEIRDFCSRHPGAAASAMLLDALAMLERATDRVATAAMHSADEIGAAAVDYLMLWGYVLMGWLWSRAAVRAEEMLEAGNGDATFLKAKVQTAAFYFARLMPRTKTLEAAVHAGAPSLMDMPADAFLGHI